MNVPALILFGPVELATPFSQDVMLKPHITLSSATIGFVIDQPHAPSIKVQVRVRRRHLRAMWQACYDAFLEELPPREGGVP